mgnify:CR=1 FL=1
MDKSQLKLKLSYILIITAIILGLLSGIGVKDLGKIILGVFVKASTRTTILTVMMVSILGGLMKHYKILNNIVELMFNVIRNKKNILIILPAMIGVLIIPGGALLSAPFINRIGEDMGLIPPRRAAINLVFRHIAMFFAPYSTSLMIISSSFPSINIFKLILLNSVFAIFMVLTGYFLYLKDIKTEVEPHKENTGKIYLRLIILTAPIYLCVILNIVTGIPMYLTLFVSVLIVYFLSEKKDFIKAFIKSLNWNTTLTVTSILFLKEIILNMEVVQIFFSNMFYNSNSMFTIIIIFFSTSLFFGFTTGNQATSLAITLPMLSQLNLSIGSLYVYTYFVYCCAFLGYFFSPLHLCQAFTLQLMNVTTKELYKEYKYLGLTLILILFGTFFIFNFLLK